MDTEKIRKDFPLLSRADAPVYLDSACMSLKPVQVIEAMTRYYEEFPACAGRSVHALSRKVDEQVFGARSSVQRFINAKKPQEIIFLRNTTEGINLLARQFPLKKGDVVVTTDKEHNSNLLPWQVQSQRRGFSHRIIESNDDNTFSMRNFEDVLSTGNVKLVSVNHVSNLDGVVNPVREIVKLAHKAGALVLLDAAQSAPHNLVNVRSSDVDFVSFSGHKMLGPTGTGVLFGKRELLESLPHDNVGGETAIDSTFDSVEWEPLPHKFEAGLQHYSGIIGLGQAAKYLSSLGSLQRHELSLNTAMTQELSSLKGLSIIGPSDSALRSSIFSFTIKGLNPHDIASILDASNIMIRSGAHCVHSYFNAHKLPGSARASTYVYTDLDDVTRFVGEVKELSRLAK